jgi:ubiquinone/menaquinone biosynthesis C-methylase UbiE
LQGDLKYLKHLAREGKGYLHPHGKAATECLINALKIENRNKLLEIGCGTGETMVRILSVYHVTIDGIDILPEMLNNARARLTFTGLKNRGKVFENLRNDAFPFPNNYYDRVYAESVIGFQSKQDAKNLIGEAHRVLKNGGLFAANDAVWKKDIPFEEIERIYRSSLNDFGLAPASEQPWTADDWINIFKEAGFEILSSDLLSDVLETKKKDSKKYIKKYFSEALTKYFYLKSRFAPSIRRESANFKKLLDKHSDDGKYIESRLFILRKN